MPQPTEINAWIDEQIKLRHAEMDDFCIRHADKLPRPCQMAAGRMTDAEYLEHRRQLAIRYPLTPGTGDMRPRRDRSLHAWWRRAMFDI